MYQAARLLHRTSCRNQNVEWSHEQVPQQDPGDEKMSSSPRHQLSHI